MFSNNSTEFQKNHPDTSPQLCYYFDKVVNFIEWSEVESQSLDRFQQMLQYQIKTNKEELNYVLANIKIDYELSRYLLKVCDEVEENLNKFVCLNEEQYLQRVESSALSKVNILFKNSSKQVKYLCNLLIFLHFASSNMGHYNKIILWFESRDIFNKLNDWQDSCSCIIKYKILTVISLLYIKYGSNTMKHEIIQASIYQRIKYLNYKKQNDIMKSTIRKSSNSAFSSSSLSSIRQSNKVKQHERIRNQIKFQSLTIFLRMKVIDLMMPDKNQNGHLSKLEHVQHQMTNNKVSISQAINDPDKTIKYYTVLTLIHKYLGEVKQNMFTEGLQQQLQYFQDRMNYYLQICQDKVKKFDYSLQKQYQKCQDYPNNISRSSSQQKNILIDQGQKIDRSKFKRSISAIPLSSQRESEQKLRDIRSIFRLSSPKQPLSQLLHKKFFEANQKRSDNKQKSKSTKKLSRGKSKSKIMAKILSNTFENAKNALRQIEFQMKSSNFDKTLNKKLSNQLGPSSSKQLIKKKKTKQQIYEKLNQNKLLSANICKKKLLEQIKNFKDISICNNVAIVEENKKCIIDHMASQRDSCQVDQQIQGQNANKNMMKSEMQSKLELIKYIGNIPTVLTVKIKPKDKSYILSISFLPPGQTEITVQITLPKSNNIFTGRYHTIWPTVKYLLRKKISQIAVVKQNQDWILEYRNVNQQQKQLIEIANQIYLRMFGIIDQDQLYQISTTLSLLAKFVDLIVFERRGMLGKKIEIFSLCNDLNLCIPPINKKSYFNPFVRKQGYRSFINMKQNIWVSSNSDLYIASYIIQRRRGELKFLNNFISCPFFLFQISCPTQIITGLINGSNALEIQIKIFEMEVTKNKSNKKTAINQNRDSQSMAQPESDSSYIYIQKFTLGHNQFPFLQINFNNFRNSVLQDIYSSKLDKEFQHLMLQISWLKFSISDNFYTPLFFQTGLFHIMEPCQYRVDSSSIPDLDSPTNKPEYSLKICQNFLQFNLDDLTQNYSGTSFGKQSTHKTIGFKRKAEKQETQKHSKIQRRQSEVKKCKIKQYDQNATDIMSHNSESKIQKQILRYVASHIPNKKYLIEFKFLTHFSPFENWIVEVSKVSMERIRKDTITLSAKDFYSLGFSFAQSQSEVLKLVIKICQSFEISKNTRIPKIVISAKKIQNLNFSIQDTNNHNSEYDTANEKLQKNQNYGSQKYRSIYLNKKYLQTSSKRSQLQMGINNCFSDSNIKAMIRQNYKKIRRRFSNEQIIKNIILKQQARKSVESDIEKLIIKRDYLIQDCQNYWYLSTYPVKLQVRDNFNCLQTFQILQLKLFNFCSNLHDNIQKGFFEFQINLSQTQYTVVCQISFQQFLVAFNLDDIQNKQKIMECLQNFVNGKTAQKIEPHKQKRRSSLKQKIKFKSKVSFQTNELNSYKTQENENNWHESSEKPQSSAAMIQKLNRKININKKQNRDKVKIAKQAFQKILSKVKIKYMHQNFIFQNQFNKCQLCSSYQSGGGYFIELRQNRFLMRIRLYQQYDQCKQCYYDVYLHSRNWKVGVGVNEGIGLGSEVQISKIQTQDHLQLMKISKSQKNNQFKVNEIKNSIFNQYSISGTLKQTVDQKQLHGQAIQVKQISNITILDLLKQYKLQHVDPICQMQPDFYTKSTVQFTKLAKYMIDIHTNSSISSQCRRTRAL